VNNILSPPLEPQRIYVIGDIHGRADLLDMMIAKISTDIAARPVETCLTVTVGDYIDRGLESRGVLDRLACNPFPTNFIALMGNHEALLATFLQDPSSGVRWLRLGGSATLQSYGVSLRGRLSVRDYSRAAEALSNAIPPQHFAFLASLRPSLTVGRYFLCHAGVRPGVPLSRQGEEDLLWIRDEFLDSTVDFGRIVVHGHTPTPDPEILPNRINVDTGAFMTGRLTCGVLEGESVRFLSASC